MRSMRPSLIPLFAVLVAVLAVGCLALQGRDSELSAAEEAKLAPQGKLPQGIRPVHYDLALRVDPELDRFRGRVVQAIMKLMTGIIPEHARAGGHTLILPKEGVELA